MLATMNPKSDVKNRSRGGTKATTVKTRRPPAKPAPYSSIGGRIRMARMACDLTQSDLSRRIGVRSQSVNQWEGGHKQPSRSSIVALARVCNVATDWLLFGPHALTRGNIPASIIPPEITGRGVPMYETIDDAVLRRGAATTRPQLVPFACGENSFAFPLPDNRCSVSGDHAGDVWFVDPDRQPSHGDMVVARYLGEIPVFGEYQLERGKNGRVVTVVRPTNKRWSAFRSDIGELEIIAVLIGRTQPAR